MDMSSTCPADCIKPSPAIPKMRAKKNPPSNFQIFHSSLESKPEEIGFLG